MRPHHIIQSVAQPPDLKLLMGTSDPQFLTLGTSSVLFLRLCFGERFCGGVRWCYVYSNAVHLRKSGRVELKNVIKGADLRYIPASPNDAPSHHHFLMREIYVPLRVQIAYGETRVDSM